MRQHLSKPDPTTLQGDARARSRGSKGSDRCQRSDLASAATAGAVEDTTAQSGSSLPVISVTDESRCKMAGEQRARISAKLQKKLDTGGHDDGL